MFENEIYYGVYATRFIASWLNAGGKLKQGYLDKDGEIHYAFKDWLKSISFMHPANGTVTELNDAQVEHIFNLATNGKLELEDSAEDFLAGWTAKHKN